MIDSIEKRDANFKVGDTIVGSGLIAIPLIGAPLSEGYEEVKENLETLGGFIKKAPSAFGSGARKVGKVLATPIKKLKPRREPPDEPAPPPAEPVPA